MNPCILIVEDDATMAEGICDTLELAGYEVMLAANGREALKRMVEHKPDLILSDIMMGEMDGYEFCQAVQSELAWVDIPFVFLTAKRRTEDIRRGKQLGVDDYLTKPFLSEDLLVVVQAKIKRAQVRQAVARAEVTTLKDELTMMIGHELRTPLTYIHGYLELMASGRNPLTEEELTTYLRGIKAGSDRLGRVVQDVLTWLAIRTGKAAHNYQLLACADEQLSTLLHLGIARFAETARERGVELVLEIAPSLPPVRVCRKQIEEILRQLLDNAIKFSPAEGGVVRVAAMETPEGIQVSVQDHGVGIPAHQLPRIFEPLFQVNRAQYEQQGTGLGLAIVRAYVELHGGRIWAESKFERGSTFYFVLPKATEAPQSGQMPVTAASTHCSTVP